MLFRSAVTGVRDERYGERVCAFVIPTDPADPPTFAEITAHFADAGVARQKTPERVEVRDDFPRTLAGKVKKYVLRDALD